MTASSRPGGVTRWAFSYKVLPPTLDTIDQHQAKLSAVEQMSQLFETCGFQTIRFVDDAKLQRMQERIGSCHRFERVEFTIGVSNGAGLGAPNVDDFIRFSRRKSGRAADDSCGLNKDQSVPQCHTSKPQPAVYRSFLDPIQCLVWEICG
jgi:hypothetical protein